MILAQEVRAANSQEGTAPTAQRRKHLDPLEVPKIGPQNWPKNAGEDFFPEDFLQFCVFCMGVTVLDGF